MNAERKNEVKVYRDGTRKMIDLIAAGLLEIFEKDGHLWVRGNNQEWQLPSKEDFARDAFLSGKQVAENLKDIAKEVGVSESALYKIIHEKYPQEATKEVCLCAMLNRERIPSLEEIDHKLIEMKRPLLYTETTSPSNNCRDYLMIRIFELAREVDRPEGGWAEFANRAILYFNNGLGNQKRILMQPLFKREKPLLLEEIRAFPQRARSVGAPLDEWEKGFLETAGQEPPTYRCQLMKEYCARENLPNITEASRVLSREIFVDQGYIRKIFSKSADLTGRRDTVIKCLHKMGCTLEEVNKMLREVNAAIIYPNSSASEDARIVEDLSYNSQKREGKES